MPYLTITSSSALDEGTISDVVAGEMYDGVSVPREFNNFSTLTGILTGLGIKSADKLSKAAAKSLKKGDRWQSADERVVVMKVR